MNVLCINCGRPADFGRACPCASVSWSKADADRIRELEAAVAERDEALRVARTMLDEVNTAHARLSAKLDAAEKVADALDAAKEYLDWNEDPDHNEDFRPLSDKIIAALDAYHAAVDAARGGKK